MARSLHRITNVQRWAFIPASVWISLAFPFFHFQASGQTTIVSAASRWSTYHGGIGDDLVLSIATDSFGHVYVAGRTTDGLLLGNDTSGRSGLTHQNAFGGGASDGFLAKLAPQGSMLWCTYFGGAGDDVAVSVVLTDMDGAYLVGNTTSAEGIATDSLAYQGAPGGGSDMFIARFTEYGLLLGASYFGSADDETASAAALDVHGRLLVSGSTTGADCLAGMQSQQPYAAGIDGLLLLFQSTDSLVAGTFIGGEGDDTVVRIAAGDSTGAVLVGNTTSTSNIATADALSATLQGGTDAFIMKVDTSLAILHGTYFGSAGEDLSYGLAQRGDTTAICGISFSDTLYTDSTAYQQTNAGGGDGFIAVLNSALELQWCTFLGDTSYDALTALQFDKAGRCYAVGITASETAISTATSQGSTLSGPTDGMVLRFDSIQTLGWSRYVGALGEEEANAFSIRGNTSIYLGGRTGSSEDFAIGGHQMTFGGGAWDGSTGRLDQKESTICDGICTGTGGGGGGGGSGNGGSGNYNGVTPPLDQLDVCVGESVTLIVYGGALGAGARWMWYADQCGVPEHFLTTGDTITFTPTQSFILKVRAESENHMTLCRSLSIVLHEYPEPLVVVTDTVCAGATIFLEGSGADAFTWAVGDTVVTGLSAQAPAPPQQDSLSVEVTATNGVACSVVLSVPIEIMNAPVPVWQVTDVTCNGSSNGMIALESPSAADLLVTWANTGLEGAQLTDLSSGTYIATVTDTMGCSSTDSLMVNMPSALLDSVSVTAALCGGPFGNAELHTASTSPGLVFSMDNDTISSLLIDELVPGNYTVLAINSAGCEEQLGFVITAVGNITVSVGDTVIVENGTGLLQAITFPIDSLASYLWSPSDGLETPDLASTNCTVSETTTYVITVTSYAGCTAVDSVVVVPHFPLTPIVPDPCGEAFLPDHFSPNEDGLNDMLCVLGGCYTSLAFNIYDRWGQRVFISSALDACWDGLLNGAQLPAGIYAFTFAAERNTGVTVERQGTITMRR